MMRRQAVLIAQAIALGMSPSKVFDLDDATLSRGIGSRLAERNARKGSRMSVAAGKRRAAKRRRVLAQKKRDRRKS